MGVGLVGIAFSGPTWLCLTIVSFFGGHNSGTASIATAVSAGAAPTGVRSGVGLGSCAITMTTAVCALAATAGVRGGIGLCSCAASVITLVTIAAAKSESWTTYMVNDRRPAFI